MEEFDEYDPASWELIQPGSDTLPDDATSHGTDDAEATSSVAHERTNNMKRVDSLESGSSLDIEILDSVYDSSKAVDMCTQRIPHLIGMSMSEDLVAEESDVSITDEASYSCTPSRSTSNASAAGREDHVELPVPHFGEVPTIPRCEEMDGREEEEKLSKKKRLRKRERRLRTKGQEDKENKKNEVASQKNKQNGEIHKKGQNENENENDHDEEIRDEHAKMAKIVGLKGGKKAEPLVEQTPTVSSHMLTVLCASQWIIDAACGAFNQSGQPYGSWPRQMPRKLQKHHLHQAPAPQYRIPGAPNPRVHQRAQALQPRKQRNRQ